MSTPSISPKRYPGGRVPRLAATLYLGLLVLGTRLPVHAAAAATAGVAFTADDRGALGAPGALTTFTTTIRNTGTVADTFTVEISRAMPAAWTVSLCEGTTCYPPFVTTITVPLAPGDDTVMEVDISPDGTAATGLAAVEVTSGNDPGLSASLDFTVLTPGLDVLVVADGPDAGQDACLAAVVAAGRTGGVWRRDQAGTLAIAELGAQPVVIWAAGPATTGLPAADLGALAYHVQHGGGLVLAGRHLVSASCDPAAPDYAPTTVGWYQVVMGVGWAGGPGSGTTVTGLVGDPIGDGFAGALVPACATPDALTPGPGVACLAYEDGATAGVRYGYGTGFGVVLGFGIADLTDADDTADLLAAILAWSGGPSDVPAGSDDLAVRVGPNPGNPAFVVRWARERPGPLRISVHDVSGRRVAVLHDGPAAAGGRVRWLGTDQGGRDVASGIYFCRVVAGREVVTRKLTLLR